MPSLNPNDAQAYNDLGNLLVFNLARRHDAETAVRKAIELDPSLAQAHHNLAILLARDVGRVAEAKAAARKAVELEPNNARYIYRLALILHEKLQCLAEAEKAYRRVIELAPNDPYYYGGLVSLLIEQSRQSEALALAAQMRTLLSTAEHWYGLATLESVVGNKDAAIEHLRRAAHGKDFDREWARRDPDLEWIRDDPRFREIVGDDPDTLSITT